MTRLRQARSATGGSGQPTSSGRGARGSPAPARDGAGRPPGRPRHRRVGRPTGARAGRAVSACNRSDAVLISARKASHSANGTHSSASVVIPGSPTSRKPERRRNSSAIASVNSAYPSGPPACSWSPLRGSWRYRTDWPPRTERRSATWSKPAACSTRKVVTRVRLRSADASGHLRRVHRLPRQPGQQPQPQWMRERSQRAQPLLAYHTRTIGKRFVSVKLSFGGWLQTSRKTMAPRSAVRADATPSPPAATHGRVPYGEGQEGQFRSTFAAWRSSFRRSATASRGGHQHALRGALAVDEIGEDPTRYLVLGPDRAGNLPEMVVLDRP